MQPPSKERALAEPDGTGRVVLAVLVLALVWGVVYWLTPAPSPAPAEEPAVSFPPHPAAPIEPLTRADPEPQHDPPDEPVLVEVEDLAAAGMAEGPGIIPPEFEAYVVERGDNAYTISERFYGDPGYWKSILRANPRVDFSRLRRGRTIRIPKDPANVQGLPADAVGEGFPAPDPIMTEYIVSRNDTLTGIAKSLYGRASLWTLIRDANPDKVNRDGTNIRPGMVLMIPPPPNPAR